MFAPWIPPGRGWACSVAAALAVAVLVAVDCNARNLTDERDGSPDGDGTMHMMELATVGVDMATRSPIVLLREPETGQMMPVWVGPAEAQAIVLAMQEVETPRPMTHDLFVNVLGELEVELVEVRIDDLREGTYFGKLVLRVGDAEETRIIDSRPSDAMALAARTGSPIQVADHVLAATPDIDFMPLQEGEQVVSALGITVIDPTAERRRQYQLPDEPGVLVLQAMGEADRRGLRRGDLIVGVDDETPQSPMGFLEAVQAAPPDAMLRIRYLRGETEHEIELPVDAPHRPTPPDLEVV